MKIHHLRNATLVVEFGENIVLIDPMLGKKGTQPPFTLFRYKPRKNPIVELPTNSESILEKVTHCLITHKHPDHIDKDAIKFLKARNIPVFCSALDAKSFNKKGLDVQRSVEYWKASEFLGGKITGVPARHGYGFIAKPMGNVMGFYIEIPNFPTLYISADTIYTDDVDKALSKFQPDITVVASGTARLDFGKPLLMTVEDIVKFVENSPKKVIANHLEAVNHCPTTRQHLKEVLTEKELIDKVFIPEDGEMMEIG